MSMQGTCTVYMHIKLVILHVDDNMELGSVYFLDVDEVPSNESRIRNRILFDPCSTVNIVSRPCAKSAETSARSRRKRFPKWTNGLACSFNYRGTRMHAALKPEILQISLEPHHRIPRASQDLHMLCDAAIH